MANTTLIGQYLAQNPYKPPKAAQKKPSGNILTHLLPSIGGTAGAIGGAAAGTAVLPGIGTLIGALLGGASAGGASKVGENLLEHNKNITSGVAGQALEQGVLGAGPIRLAKAATFGVKAGVDAAKTGQGLEGAITAATQKSEAPILAKTGKNLVTQGQQAQGRVAGISAGTKVANKELSPQDTKLMLDTLKSEGIKTGNANNTFRDVQDKLTQYGKQISDHFTGNNTPLTRPQINSLAKDYVSNLKTTDPSVLKQANVIANDLKKNVTDTKSLWQFRKTLDGRIPDSKFMDASTTDKIAALKAMRQHITTQLGNVPGASNYHALAEIKPFISGEAKRLNNPGGGIIGRVAASGPVQKAESLVGRTTEKVGNALGGNSGADVTSGLSAGRIAGRTLPVGVLQANAQNAQDQAAAQVPPAQDPSTQQNPQDLMGALLAAQGQGQDQAQQSNSPYSQENLMADIQRDPKHAKDYIDTYKSLDGIFNPAGTTKALNSTQQQQAFNAQSGLDSLNKIAQTLQQNPNAAKESNIPGGGLLASVTGTGAYQAAINNAIDVIGRLRSGGAIGQEEEKNFKRMLPAFSDNQQTIDYKLQQLASLFQKFANPQSAQPGANDLTTALMQSGYGG